MLPKTALGTMATDAMKFFTMIGLYGLDFSLNSTVFGSVALTESMYSRAWRRSARRGLAELEGEDDVVGREIRPVGPLGAVLQRQYERVVVGLLQLLGKTPGSEPSSMLKRSKVS